LDEEHATWGEFKLHFTQAYGSSKGNVPNGYHKASNTIKDYDSLESVTHNFAGNQMTIDVQQQATKNSITRLTAQNQKMMQALQAMQKQASTGTIPRIKPPPPQQPLYTQLCNPHHKFHPHPPHHMEGIDRNKVMVEDDLADTAMVVVEADLDAMDVDILVDTTIMETGITSNNQQHNLHQTQPNCCNQPNPCNQHTNWMHCYSCGYNMDHKSTGCLAWYCNVHHQDGCNHGNVDPYEAAGDCPSCTEKHKTILPGNNAGY
jgi:hypothetical protein